MFLKIGMPIVCAFFFFGQSADLETDRPSLSRASSNGRVKIEIWSDMVCPFCLIGKKKLEKTIRKLKADQKVEIIWHSYQLDPDFPKGKSISSTDYLVQRKGISKGQLTGMYQQLSATGKQYGIDFQFNKAISYNTDEAHQIWKWSKKFGKEDAWNEATMKAHFTDGLDLSSRSALLKLVEKVGLDVREAEKVLQTKQFSSLVQDDIRQSQKLGIGGVPYFLIKNKEVISGAEDDAVFEQTLRRVLGQ